MRLLILQDYLRIGGTERQSIFLARYFQQAGDDVHLLTFRPGGHLAEREHLTEFPVSTLQPFDSRLSLWAPRLHRSIRKIQPDIILCMGRTANCYAGFIQKAFPAIPVVGTLRTGKMLFPLHHWSVGVVRAVLVNSNWWKRRLLERQFPESRIHVVHNAVLLERTEEERLYQRKQLRQQFNISPETTLFLNVATFRPGKRHIDLLRMMAQLRQQQPGLDWRLWLVGDGRDYKRCRHWAASNGLGTRVRFFHFQRDPFPFYAAADIAVSASREDSLPNFLIEAQATKLPVIAYDCRGVNETCLPGKSGIILPPNQPQAFLNALLSLTLNRELRQQFGQAAIPFVKQRFSPIPQAQAIREFLTSLIL